MTLPQPADPAMTDEEIERLFAWLYKAKTAIYLATEASVADDISSNLVRVTKVLTAEIAARKEAEERTESFRAMYHQACDWRDAKITELETARKVVDDAREAHAKCTTALIAAAEARIAELVAAPTHQAIMHAVASLAAAISLLERTPETRWAAPSNKMFAQMLDDYRNALANARTALGGPNDR